MILREYLKEPKKIGTITPDSCWCVKKLLKKIDFSTAKVIVEWGGGSGAVTSEIVKKKKEKTLFICFESNPNLFRSLSKKFSGNHNVIILYEDIFLSEKILSVLGIRKVDFIVSTLPFSNLATNEFLHLASSLTDKIFTQYLHSLSLFKFFFPENKLKKYFSKIEKEFVLLNLPPAFVYYCQR